MAYPKGRPQPKRTWWGIQRQEDGLWLAGTRKMARPNYTNPKRTLPLYPAYSFSASREDAVQFHRRSAAQLRLKTVSKRYPNDHFQIVDMDEKEAQ